MKITKVEPLLLDRFLYVRVHTDSGIVGLGESEPGVSWKPRPRQSRNTATTSSARTRFRSSITGT